MDIKQTEQQSFHISQEKMLAFVRAMIGGSRGHEDDEYPLPPGPWDPVIRTALERISWVSGVRPEPWKVNGPHPEPWQLAEFAFGQGVPWRWGNPIPWSVVFASILTKHPEISDALGGGHSFSSAIELNPQPLPPRHAFLVSVVQTVISRAELMQELADAIGHEGNSKASIIASNYISRFIDDCGTGIRLRYPFPGPRPHWFTKEFDGIDLVVMATQFEQAAKETFSQDLRQYFVNASTKLMETGMLKMQ